jgi:plastocyanin
MNRRTIAIAAIAALAAGSLLLAACGDDDDQTGSDMPAMGDEAGMGDDGHGGHDDEEENSPVADGARQIEVTAADFAFDPDEVTAEAGEDLAIVLTSEDLLHDFVIDEIDAHVAADRGETAEGGVTADEAGTYTYYCSVPGHREAGMEGTLTVE